MALVFLAQLLIIIAFLSSEVLLQTNLLSIPYMLLLRNVLPEVYGEVRDVSISPYFTTGLLLVSVMTLVLFFASGMYSEKIGYANRYVCHLTSTGSGLALNAYIAPAGKIRAPCQPCPTKPQYVP